MGILCFSFLWGYNEFYGDMIGCIGKMLFYQQQQQQQGMYKTNQGRDNTWDSGNKYGGYIMVFTV